MLIGIVAGEPSGDLLGAHLVKSLKAYFPDAEFVGIGGAKMQSEGVTSLFSMEKLSVMGYVEVLKRYAEIAGIRRNLIRYLKQNPPAFFIGVDAPDFNLHIEGVLKKRGIPSFHYVSPSIWAWRGERIKKIRKCCSKMLVLFPFEAPIYEKAGIPVSYVGHPLADILPENPDRTAMRQQMKIPLNGRVIALLPGSRHSELSHMADTFIQTAMRIHRKWPDTQFLVPLISRETRNFFDEAIYKNGAEEVPFTLLFAHAQKAMIAADVVLVASGTATLEAMLLKRPMVITYKMASLTYRIAKKKQYLPYVGLPNVLAGEFVVPEILQDDATPENLSLALMNLVQDEIVVDKLERKFSQIHRELKQNTGEKAAMAIIDFLKA